MANLKLALLVIYYLGAGPILSEGVEAENGAVSDEIESRGFIKRRLCKRFGICGQNSGGGFGGYQQGGYNQGYQGQIPPINIGISQSQSSASNGQGGGYNGYYPNNYQYNHGYPGNSGHPGSGGYQGYGGYNQGFGGHGGYGQRPGYFGNGNGGYNSQFNGNYHGGNGAGFGFQGGPIAFDEYSDDINGGHGEHDIDGSAANVDINGAPVGNYDQGQSDYDFAGRKNN